MACIIERVDKKSGAIYLYESVCYWDRETSRPKTRQTYIGKKDRITGEIVPPRRKLANKAKQNPKKNFENHLDTTEQVIQTEELIDLPMIEDDGAFCTTRIIGPYLLLELISKQLG
ncbi:MAG: hypothetical protein LBT47_00890, partial [Deltaproteobacteria bacterium]|nr:hypothetical protein [Deltaproteobacteria bacterium]